MYLSSNVYLYSNVYLNGLVLAVAGIRAGVRPSSEPSLPDASSLHLPYDLCFASWIWDLLDFYFNFESIQIQIWGGMGEKQGRCNPCGDKNPNIRRYLHLEFYRS